MKRATAEPHADSEPAPDCEPDPRGNARPHPRSRQLGRHPESPAPGRGGAGHGQVRHGPVQRDAPRTDRLADNQYPREPLRGGPHRAGAVRGSPFIDRSGEKITPPETFRRVGRGASMRHDTTPEGAHQSRALAADPSLPLSHVPDWKPGSGRVHRTSATAGVSPRAPALLPDLLPPGSRDFGGVGEPARPDRGA